MNNRKGNITENREDVVERIAVASQLRSRDGRRVVSERIYEDVVKPMLDELEDKDKRIAELETKLANPVSLPKTNGYWNEQEKAYEEAITLARRQIRLAGFRCEGDE